MYKLLIVDDNNTHIECVKDYVDWHSLKFTEIKTAPNGKRAFEIFKSDCPDLIITDVAMPVCDGLELVRKIREINQNVHIIFMSCYEDFNYIKQAIDNNITAYILKPLSPAELQEKVSIVIKSIEANKRALATKRILSEFMPLVRESLLYRLLYTKNFKISDDILKNAQFNDFKNAIIAKYLVFNNCEEECLLLYEMLNHAKKKFPDFCIEAIASVPNNLILFIMSDENDSEIFLNNAISAIHSHIKDIENNYGISVTAGVSSVFSDISEVSLMLRQAELALESTYSPQSDEIYLFESFDEVSAQHTDYDLYNLKQELSDILDNSDRQAAIDSFLQKYYPDNKVLNKNTIKALCFSTVTSLQFLLLERNADINDLFETPNIIWTKLSKFETIQNTYQWLKNTLIACCEYISKLETHKYNQMVSRIKDYIDQNFKDITSVEQIASVLFISPGYAKNVFKKYTGQTIFDYLIETRMNEAKRLLQNPDIRIYEVSERVGYISKAHFSETFKRKTGITPKEYQLRGKPSH